MTFELQTSNNNPFNGMYIVDGFFNPYSAISLVDMDGDDDLDVVLPVRTSTSFMYYQNTGNKTNPIYSLENSLVNTYNLFNGINMWSASRPTFGDLDGDGDFDAVLSVSNTLKYYKNTGSATDPFYSEQTGSDNPFNNLGFYGVKDPTLADIDGDGDLDAVVGTTEGTIEYYKNTGSATNPVYSEQTGNSNPFNGIYVASESTPTLADINGDGYIDAVVGSAGSAINYYKNNGDGNDIISGDAGNNTFKGGRGNDSIDGGTGEDVFIYQGVYTDYAVSILSNGNIQLVDQNTANGDEGTDTLTGIEQINFANGGIYRVNTGDAANNVLSANPSYVALMFGGAGNDNITGAPGPDTLAGGADDDTLAGGAGNDSIDGGTGNDVAVYQGVYTDYAVSILSNGNIQLVDQNTANGNEGTDTLSGIEQINFANGGMYRVVTGSAANDVLSTNLVWSLMFGGAGNDNITGGAGHDTLAGGAGNDSIDGGSGFDYAVLQGHYTDYAVSILNNGSIQLVDQNPANGNEGTDILSGIEQINFAGGGIYRVNTGDAANNVLSANPSYVALMFGGAGNDNITGAPGPDTLAGGADDDTLAGGAGNDSILGGAGNDLIDGGTGNDVAGYQGAYTDYAVSILSNGNIQLVDQNTANGNEGTDILTGIEQINFAGGSIYRVYTGSTGNDVLTANPLYVSLMFGGDGNDSITGTSGFDTLAGGADNDTIAGGAGSDSITGGSGHDTLAGGADNDTIVGGAGDDSITGGTGADRFVFNALPKREIEPEYGFDLSYFPVSYPEGVDEIADFKRSEGDKVLINGATTGITSTADFQFDFNAKMLYFKEMSVVKIAVPTASDFSVSSDVVIF